MTGFVTAEQISRKFSLADLSALPTSNPGGGKPWLSGGAVVVGNYAGNTVDWSAIANKPTEFPPSAHTHDDHYYTKSQIDAGYATLAGNTFTGNQVVSGNITTTGNVTFSGSGQRINFLADSSATGSLDIYRTGDITPLMQFVQFGSSPASRRVTVRGEGVNYQTDAGAERVSISQYGVRVTQGLGFEFSSSSATAAIVHRLIRDATAATIDSRCDNGFRSRNFANNADAPVTCSNLRASGNVLAGSGSSFPITIGQNGSIGSYITFGSGASTSGLAMPGSDQLRPIKDGALSDNTLVLGVATHRLNAVHTVNLNASQVNIIDALNNFRASGGNLQCYSGDNSLTWQGGSSTFNVYKQAAFSAGLTAVNGISANNLTATSVGSSFGGFFDGTIAVNVRPNLASRVGMAVRLLASQTADGIQVQNSAGTVLAAISATGEIWSGASTSSYVGPTRVSWGAGGAGGGSITNGAITVGPNSKFSFSPSNGIAAGDAAFSRIDVGVVGLGNGALADASAELRLGTLVVSGVVTSAFRTISADPTTLDISAGRSQLVKNTTSGEIRHWANDGGTMKKSAALT